MGRIETTKKQITTYICTIAALLLLIAGFAQYNETHSVKIPILMYHHLADTDISGSTISAETFETHIKALAGAGYTAVSFEDLRDYVFNGATLPTHPIVITFDDGYQSVYDAALPILQKYNTKATAFIVGIFHGENVYKGSNDRPITPHFGDAEAKEMVESGIFSIQSHSFDMHQLVPYEDESPRVGILKRKEESNEEYVNALTADFRLASDQIEGITGVKPFVFSYPYGRFTLQAEKLLKNMGVLATVTTVADFNTIVRNSPGTLFGMGRFNVPGDMTAEELLSMIDWP